MMQLVTFKSAVMNGFRSLKVLAFGNTAVTADECAPFGIDSNPLQNMIAIYADTEECGEPVIIGYLNQNQLAANGETRLFSLMPNGTLSIYAWLKNNGTMELAGNENNLVRYTALSNALTEQDTAINTELQKIAIAIASLGGTYVLATINTDISASKINEIKCI